MPFNFDDYGWFDPTSSNPNRKTNSEPQITSGTPEVGQPWPTWSGVEWILINYTLPEVPVVPEVVVPKKITKLAFISRFTDAEAIALDLASIGATVQAASMRRFLNKVDAATFIDLTRPDTIGGVQYLESVGLIGTGRADVILNAPITDIERAK